MSSSQSPPPPPPPPPPHPNNPPKQKQKQQEKNRDFLTHLESYLAKRDGIDKLLKISRYTTKLILASNLIPKTQPNPLHDRLKSFESSVGLSRKAFRLGKFVQDLNALRALTPPRVQPNHKPDLDLDLDFFLSVIAYGGEGLYYFVEQIIWLAKSGLIDAKRWRFLQKVSAWCEFVGYFGSVALKWRDLKALSEDEECLRSSVKISVLRGVGCEEEQERLRKVREKKVMKRLSIVQDLADSVMALDDIVDGKGLFSTPVLMASAGLLSALISTHKNWKAS